MRYEIQIVMSISLFVIGVLSSLSGLWIILAKEYHQTMKELSSQSIRSLVPCVAPSARA